MLVERRSMEEDSELTRKTPVAKPLAAMEVRACGGAMSFTDEGGGILGLIRGPTPHWKLEQAPKNKRQPTHFQLNESGQSDARLLN